MVSAIAQWKTKLIDVSKRNRALNFKPTPVTTVRIIDEYPPQVFKQLYLLDGKLRFRVLPANESADLKNPPESHPATSSGDEVLDQIPSVDFISLNAEELGQDRTDNFLQTNLTTEKLQNSLRRIAEQAQSSLEEQGVNTLFLALGALHYKETAQSNDVFQAPLILLPVQVNRTSASSPFNVTATDEDPFVNPSLVEHMRTAQGVSLPELPDRDGLSETYDLQSFYRAVEEAVRDKDGWRVTSDIFLSFFSFQKYVMFKDLESNQLDFAEHRIVRQVVRRTGTSLRELPPDVQSAELDENFPAERTAQVVDADSSQLRAIYAAGLGHDLVLVGPPGTGKSQTITNLIAQALSANKSVLFVAEKRAALEVVYSRLVEAGLGEFCLELHSNKANKRDVLRGIAHAWDVSLQDPEWKHDGTDRLPVVRDELTTYTDDVHSPFGNLHISPYRALWELERVRNAPKIEFRSDLSNLNQQELDEACRNLTDLAREIEPIGVPALHPLRDTTQTLYLEADLDHLEVLLKELIDTLTRVIEAAPTVANDFGIPALVTLDDVSSAAAIAAMLNSSPGAPLRILSSELWNSAPPGAVNLLALGREVKTLRAQIHARFTERVLEKDHAQDIAFIEAKEHSLLGFLNFTSGQYRAVKARWLSYRKPSYNPTMLELANDLRSVDRYRVQRQALEARDTEGSEYFGLLWRGEYSDWTAMEGYIKWVVEFRTACVQKGLSDRAMATAAQPHPDITPVLRLKEVANSARTALHEISGIVKWPANYFEKKSMTEIRERAISILKNLNSARDWARFEMVRAQVAAGSGVEMLPSVISGSLKPADFVIAFRRAFFQSWISNAVRSLPSLANFSTLRHEERVAEFRRLDLQVLEENRRKLVRELRQRLRKRVREEKLLNDPIAFLRTQITLQRGHRPLRVTMERAFAAVRAIKPVFMMSPLSVAQFLKRDAITPFDLVIFDEASQLPSEDSVGAIARGSQLIVVGDPNQLPPTNFFSVINNGGQSPRDENGDPIILDGASILEEFGASGPPSTTLRWHYRSAHESLITFSNASFYKYELFTFPSVDLNSQSAGLVFEYVPDGLYEGAGLNRAEAKKVADAVIDHARRTPEVSLGVGTFNLKQQIAIIDELEFRRREDPTVEPFFDKNRREPFFVKNLENIQGDERDYIFLSVTYAKNADGELKHFFGPLNSDNGWKRLNVLTTRARKGMRVFSSIKGEDIDPTRVTTSGPKFLRNFLIYAEYGRLDQTYLNELAKTESRFEDEVYHELTLRGLKLTAQVGAAGYRIDFGVRDDKVPERFICGIECDGATYHLSETARDRDRLRQQVLQIRGWTILRIWSADWFKDREGQIARILKLVEGARQRTIEEVRLEREDKERVHREAEPPPAIGPLVSRDSGTRGLETTSQLVEVESVGTVLETQATGEYVMAPATQEFSGQEMNNADSKTLDSVILDVAKIEAPLHIHDLAQRVAARWGHAQVGTRIMEAIKKRLQWLDSQSSLSVRNNFVYLVGSNSEIKVRSRLGTGIPAERIAPEEYTEAVLSVLSTGEAFNRDQLIKRVRGRFGYSRTGNQIKQQVGAAIDLLLREDKIGEGSTGIRLRVND